MLALIDFRDKLLDAMRTRRQAVKPREPVAQAPLLLGGLPDLHCTGKESPIPMRRPMAYDNLDRKGEGD